MTHAVSALARRHDTLRGVWRLVDPKIALASIVPLVSAAVLAWHEGFSIRPPIFVGALFAVFAIEVGKNAINDLYDFRSGADTALRDDERSPFSGGKRVLVDRLLDERSLALVGAIAFTAAALIGTEVAFASDPRLLILGLAGALISYEYTAPPLRLSYRGLGEFAVFLSYGPGIFLGTTYLFAGRLSLTAICASIAFGALIANVLLINEFPDERVDRAAGKRTLVVRLGRRRATWLVGEVFAFAMCVAFAAPVIGASERILGIGAAVVPALIAVHLLQRQPSGPPVRAQAATLLAYVVAGAGFVTALFV